jgi:integrase
LKYDSWRSPYPRWYAFVLTGLLGGLRWGESTALQLGDIDWKRGRLHVQRSFSDKTNRIEAPKSGKARWVQPSPELLAALRSHIEAMTLEGQVNRWTPVQGQLGHASIGQTAACYGHVQHDRHASAVNGLDEYLR